MRIIMLILPLMAVSSVQAGASRRRSKYGCEGTVMHLECEAGKTISPVRANFGRFEAGVCNSEGNQAWSTRCIQPTSLRQVNQLCRGQTSCSIDVTSAVFGEPCPGTYKYLEVHYTCVSRAAVAADRASATSGINLPPWLLAMAATTARPSPSTTTGSTTSTTAVVQELVVEIEEYPTLLEEEYPDLSEDDSEDRENELSLEELLFNQRKEVFINLPLTEPEVSTLEVEEDMTVLVATLVSAISCTLVIFVSVLLYTRFKQQKKKESSSVSCQQLSPASSSNSQMLYDYECVSSGSSTVSSVYTSLPPTTPTHLGSVYTTLPNGDSAIIIPLRANPAYLNNLVQQQYTDNNKQHYFVNTIPNSQQQQQLLNAADLQQLLNPCHQQQQPPPVNSRMCDQQQLAAVHSQENLYIDIDQLNAYRRY